MKTVLRFLLIAALWMHLALIGDLAHAGSTQDDFTKVGAYVN